MTVPVLIAVFTVGSFGIGALLRGSDVILNEIAIVRGAPGTDAAVAQSYLGIFSPSRATYQLRVAGDALLALPMNGDMFGGTTAQLDVLQGDPSRVRDLSVGFGSLRTIRAEASATAPKVSASLRLDEGRIRGTVTNDSDQTLIAPALVLGSSASMLPTSPPAQTADVDLRLTANGFNGQALSDTVVGPYDWDGGPMNETQQRNLIRRSVIDQLSFDPNTGDQRRPAGRLADAARLGQRAGRRRRARGRGGPPRGQRPVRGPAAVSRSTAARRSRGDMLRSNALDVSANFFSKDPWSISFGIGEVTMAYQPLPFEGTLTPERVVLAMGFGGDIGSLDGNHPTLQEQERCDPAADGCVQPQDGLPEIEVLDVRTGEWVQFAHMAGGQEYELENAARWVDPTTGQVQVKFVNERQDGSASSSRSRSTGSVE